MKLCLGAGYEPLSADPDWITVDLDPNTPVDVHCDVRDLPEGWTATFDEVRAVDILEHLSYRDTVPALREWARVLVPGGLMYVQVPAADEMMHTWACATSEWVAPSGDKTVGQRVLSQGVPGELDGAPLMVKLAWRLLGGHFDGQYTRDSAHWHLNAHHALFDEQTIRWAAEQAGLTVESIEVNPHPNYLVWLVKP